MPWPTSHELDDLVARFRARTLSKHEWTHLAHLAVGTWHVHAHGPDQALELLRSGITRLNEAHGTVNDDAGGYHETITRAYVRLLSDFMGRHSGLAAADCVRVLLVSPLAEKTALLRYYSKQSLGSVTARKGWVEPDLEPLPLTGSTPCATAD
jgi:hypothetical protein